MSSQANTPDGSLTRRRFMKIGAVGTVGAAGLGGAGDLAPSAVGDSEAFACGGLCIAAGAAGAGLAVGWALREFEVVGADDPAEGLTPDVLQNQIYDAALKRQSNNRSTFVDNENIVSSGLRHTLYGDGKMAAIEALNAEKSESEVLADANDAAESYATTVQKNFLDSWNESVNEVINQYETAVNHPDLSFDTVFGNGQDSNEFTEISKNETTHTLPDGTDYTLNNLYVWCGDYSDNETYYEYSPLSESVNMNDATVLEWTALEATNTNGDTVRYLRYPEWNSVWETLETALAEVKDGLSTWVTSVYSDVQAGDLNTEDLMTSRELAEMSADEEGFNQAVADLMALNISVNLEREAEVTMPETGSTVQGQIGVTGDATLETGTVDPSADDVDYYFTYDISQAEGTWTDYETGIDGGTATFTAEPYENAEFDIETNGGETVTVTAEDFTGQGDGTWTADLSEQLETDIAEINSVAFYSTTSETQFETVQLTETFEIVTFRDTESGDEYDSAEHTSNEPQDDTNYLTEEEWTDMEERQQELIDKYEESQTGGGGLLPGGGDGGIVGLIVLAALGGAAFLGR